MKTTQALEEYLIDHQIKGHSWHTLKHYKSNITAFSIFTENIDIENIEHSHLKEYYIYLIGQALSSVTVQTYFRAIRAFLTWCYNEGYIKTNLSEKFRLPKAKRHVIDVLTDNEISQLIKCFNIKTFYGIRDICIVFLMLDSGLRVNEVATLKHGDVHIVEGYLKVLGKGNKERYAPLGLNTKKHLLKYLHHIPCPQYSDTLFVDDQITPLKLSAYNQLFKRLKKRSKIPRLRAHLLRHTFATRYIEAGGDIYSLQSILGHTTLEMVKKYVHLTPSKITDRYAKFSPLDNLMQKSRKPV